MNPQEFANKIRQKYPGAYDNVPDLELTQKVIAKYPVYASQVNISAAPEKQGFGQRISQDFSQRSANIDQSVADYKAGKQSFASGVLQTAGEIAGGVTDIGIEAVKSIPGVNKFLGMFGEKVIKPVAQTETAQNLLSNYETWKSQNPVAAKNLEAVIDIASIIPVGGAGALGVKGAEKGIQGAVKTTGKIVAKNAENRALQSGIKEIDAVTELVMEKAKKQNVITAAMEGRATQSGKVKSFDILPSARDTEMAKDVLSVSKSGRNVAETLSDINKAIPDISENQVRPFLRANPRAFNVQTVNSRLNAIEMPDLFKTDASLEKTYNLVRQRMVNVIEKHPKTTEGLWDARKEFDKIVKEQFGDAAFDSEKNTAIKRAVQDMRREVNNFISEQVGDNTFKTQMNKLSNLYEAQYNLGEKFYDLRNTNAFKRWAKENPIKAKAIGITVGGGITGTILSKIFGD